MNAYAGAELLVKGLAGVGRFVTRPGFVDALSRLYRFETGVVPPLTYTQNRREFMTKGLKAAEAMIQAGKFEEMEQALGSTVLPLFQTAKKDAEALLQLLLDVGREEYETAQRNYVFSLIFAAVLLTLGFLAAGGLGLFTLRAVTRPLARLGAVLQEHRRGQLQQRDRDRERGRDGRSKLHRRSKANRRISNNE